MLNANEREETWERLQAYPSLLEKVKGMLDLMERGHGSIKGNKKTMT